MSDNIKYIAYICDDKYVLPTIVSIQSLCNVVKNSKNNYVVYVCAFSLKNENIKLIESVKASNVKIQFKQVDEELYKEQLKKINIRTHVSSSALIKFELANIFSDLDELLYLDSDIIIRKDISRLFDVDLSEYYLAAVREYWRIHNEYYEGGKTSDKIYYNSGVMYLNLKKFRQDDLPNKLWIIKLGEYNDLHDKSKLMDQDALNKACAGKCYCLPIKYNCDPKLTVGWANFTLLNDVYKTKYNSEKELFDDVCIMHYLGKTDKPWKYKNATHGDAWYNVYCESVVRNIPLVYEKNISVDADCIGKIKSSLATRGFMGTLQYFYKTRIYRRIR